MSQFALDTPIYHFNHSEPFTIRQACEGVQIFGGIGSGKTSGSGASLARAYLKAGFGGLVLCAKKDELATWQQYAKETGREQSLLVFDASGEYRFPFLQYETRREGEGAGNTENLVRLFMTVQESIERSKGSEGTDPYWSRAMQQLMRNAIDLAMLSDGKISVPLMKEIVLSAPKTVSELDTQNWKDESLCWQLLLKCHAKKQENLLSKWEIYDYESTADYWLNEYPNLSEKTRSSILSIFTSLIDNFLRRPFRMLFSDPPEDWKKIIFPELTHQGVVIVMNLPVKEFGEAGRAAQLVYKYIWQQAAERRKVDDQTRPIFLWVDEAQNFATEYDMQFQATARSSRACTVYMTQNLPNYYAEMGGEHSRYRVDSLVGNLQTKIWHANSDPSTNQNASETIGKSWQLRESSGQSIGADVGLNRSVSESFDYDVIPQTFTRLAKGGHQNNYMVQGVVFQNGRLWNNKKTFLLAQFNQNNS